MKLLLLCFVVFGGLRVNAKSNTKEWHPIPVDDVDQKMLDTVILFYGAEYNINDIKIQGSVTSPSDFKVEFVMDHLRGPNFRRQDFYECKADVSEEKGKRFVLTYQSCEIVVLNGGIDRKQNN